MIGKTNSLGKTESKERVDTSRRKELEEKTLHRERAERQKF